MNKRVTLVLVVSVVGILLLAGQTMSQTLKGLSKANSEQMAAKAGDMVDFSKAHQCQELMDSLKTFGRIESKIESFGVYKSTDFVCHFQFDTSIENCEIKGDVYRNEGEKFAEALNLCDTIRAAFLSGRKMQMYYDSSLTSKPPLLHIMTVDILSE